jgi:hypothetical protein
MIAYLASPTHFFFGIERGLGPKKITSKLNGDSNTPNIISNNFPHLTGGLTKNSISHKTLLKDINIIWHKRSITWGRNWWWSAGDLWKFRGCKRKFT